MIVLATSSTNSINLSVLAAKSVSTLISTTTPTFLASSIFVYTRPSAAILPDFLAAFARPFSRRFLIAASTSPFVSSSALLQSIIPQFVSSFNCFTACAEIAIVILLYIYIRFRLFFCSFCFSLCNFFCYVSLTLSCFDDSVSHSACNKLNCTDSVIVTGDYIVDLIGIAVCIYDSYYGDTELLCF